MTHTVSLGGAQGFYGDSCEPVAALADACDYLILDGLAELTLALLQKERQRDEEAGWVPDLIPHAQAFLPAVIEGRVKVITNGGGLNPPNAGRALAAAARVLGKPVRVACVTGDDITPRLGELHPEVPADVRFANAYLGARPIVEALAKGADIVVTGRVADSALALAPLVYEHGWDWQDWDSLAAGTIVGHLIECTGQATGGNLSWRWWDHVSDFTELPFPIAEVDAAGVVTISKLAGSGGTVSIESVREQLLYEIHDPAAYIVPDVVADLSDVRLTQVGHDRVRVSGVRGHRSPNCYKALICTPAGWTGDIAIGFGWPDAPAKAYAMADIVKRRTSYAGLKVDEWAVEVWGHDALLPGHPIGDDPSEVVLRIAWRCADRDTASRIGRLVPPLYTSGPVPGMTTAGRAFRFDASELFETTSILIARESVDPQLRVDLIE